MANKFVQLGLQYRSIIFSGTFNDGENFILDISASFGVEGMSDVPPTNNTITNTMFTGNGLSYDVNTQVADLTRNFTLTLARGVGDQVNFKLLEGIYNKQIDVGYSNSSFLITAGNEEKVEFRYNIARIASNSFLTQQAQDATISTSPTCLLEMNLGNTRR